MIKSVTKKTNPDGTFWYIMVMNDDKEWWVPHVEANTKYQEILEWVAAGNTISE